MEKNKIKSFSYKDYDVREFFKNELKKDNGCLLLHSQKVNTTEGYNSLNLPEKFYVTDVSIFYDTQENNGIDVLISYFRHLNSFDIKTYELILTPNTNTMSYKNFGRPIDLYNEIYLGMYNQEFSIILNSKELVKQPVNIFTLSLKLKNEPTV